MHRGYLEPMGYALRICALTHPAPNDILNA